MGRHRPIAKGTPEELAPLRNDETRVRVWTELGDDEWQSVASWIAERPTLRLSVKGIRDLQPLAEAPALEALLLIGMAQLGPEDLRPFVGHPTLRAGILGFGSARKNEEAQGVLPLPPSGTDPLPWNQPDWTGIQHWNRRDD